MSKKKIILQGYTTAEHNAQISKIITDGCNTCWVRKACDEDSGTSCEGLLRANIEHVPPVRWRAECGGRYFYVDTDGRVEFSAEYGTRADDARYTLGNYFCTEADAERAAEYVKAAFECAQEELEGDGE